jgi:hypothetical protein
MHNETESPAGASFVLAGGLNYFGSPRSPFWPLDACISSSFAVKLKLFSYADRFSDYGPLKPRLCGLRTDLFGSFDVCSLEMRSFYESNELAFH